MKRIYAVLVDLTREVYVRGVGLASAFNMHVYADGPEEARRLGRAYCVGRDLPYLNALCMRELDEVPLHRRVFVQNIVGLPLEMGEEAIRAKELGGMFTGNALEELRRNHELWKAGLAQLESMGVGAA